MADGSRKRASLRVLGDGYVGLWCHYDDKDAAKALPGARWDKGLTCWRVPEMFRAEAERLVDRLNGGVDSALVDHLVAVFRALPAGDRQPTYRALVKVWHPDAGGDDRAMKALTAAWDETRP